MGEIKLSKEGQVKDSEGGLEDSGHTSLLKFLTANPADYQLFYERFWEKDEPIINALIAFQKYKIKLLNVQYNEFVLLAHNTGIKDAFELLLQQPVDDYTVERIRDKVYNKTITTREIYDKFKGNEGIDIIRFTHGRRRFE